MATRTSTRTRLSVSSVVLLVGALASACGSGGGGGAPDDASAKDFCQTQTSLLEDLLPDDMTNPKLPSGEDMAQAVKDWGAKIEKVGTPDDISDDARKGFERIVEMAGDIDPADFSIDKLDELQAGGAEASAKAKKQADAFAKYLTETCGNPLDSLDLPEMPESS